MKSPVSDADTAFEELPDESSLQLREDVRPHTSPPSGSITERLYTLRCHSGERRVCVTENGAKNLVATEAKGKQVAGEKADTRSLLFQFAWSPQETGIRRFDD